MLETRSGCDFDIDRGPDWLLVRPRRLEADPATPPMLADAIWGLAEEHFIYRIVLEMDQVKILDSHLIEQLLCLNKRLQEHDGMLRLCGLSAYNRRLLRGGALEDQFPAYDSRHEAVLGGCDPRLPR